jgi:transposase
MSEFKSLRTYDAEFKLNAVKLSKEPNKTVQSVAKGLGIPKESLYRWRKESDTQGALAFPGKGVEALTEEQKRIKNLEAQLKDVEMERDILKKAVGIFSRVSK